MLHVSQLTVAYGKRDVVRGLSAAALPAGTLTVLLGPNGSGKSTLLKGMVGLVRPSAGNVVLDDIDLARLSPRQRAQKIGYLPQALLPSVHLRVLEAVLVAAGAAGSSADFAHAQALLQRLGLQHLAMSFIDELSGGQRQMVALAQALVREPRVLLLDEPLASLDLNYQFHVMRLLRQETQERGLVTIVVLHDVDTAMRYADGLWLMRDGQLLADGAPTDVITPENLALAYGVQARIETGASGVSQIIVDGLREPIN